MRRRVRREPIDLVHLAVELAETPEPVELDLRLDLVDPEPAVPVAEPVPAEEPVTAGRDEHDIVAALEAEVLRAALVRAAETVEPAAPSLLVPPPVVAPPPPVGLPLDQVRAWLEQVKDDLRKVQARLQYLEVEHTKLQDQHHLVAELISTSSPV